MAKVADVYFSVDPWNIVEDGFNPDYAMVSESVFSLGNEYMGVRGYFDEGYSGQRLQGSYVNGVFERKDLEKTAYRGMTDHMTYMVNTVDWLSLRLCAEGETLDLNRSRFRDFRRVLHLRTGILTRTFVWILPSGHEISLCFERFLSMGRTRFGGQRLTARALNFDGVLAVEAGLDLSRPHASEKENLWDCLEHRAEGTRCEIGGRVRCSGHLLHARCEFNGDFTDAAPCGDKEKYAGIFFTLPLMQGADRSFHRVVDVETCTDPAVDETEFFRRVTAFREALPGYEALEEESAAWWTRVWEHSDILIEGDEANQQGIRFCIFQMHQTYHGAEHNSVIGAKGLTGEAYNGNTFWDTETYCLNFYLFNNPQAAKNLLMFRYHTLREAQSRAEALDCRGAFYPIATIDGTECCNLWQHASLQLQASTGVAYGIRHYVQVTGDTAFLRDYGAPLLVEICRMLASRGDWSPVTGEYGYYGVMGPDEFQMMVNNNCYTNFMAKKTFEYTLSVLPADYGDVSPEEREAWRGMAEKMEIPYEESTKLFEQNEGFFRLPHVDVDSIPVEEFPLYSHWSYDHIYRNDMIKQPDVLMMLFLYNSCFTAEQKRKNYAYYEPRCIHESSLSPSVHSILASELGMDEKAYEFFRFATRLDLDNYNRNTAEGLHTTSIAAAWMNIIYGFGGMRSDGTVLRFSPSIPAQWNRYSFRLIYGGDILCVTVTQEGTEFNTLSGKEIDIKVYGAKVRVGAAPAFVPLSEEREAEE